MNYNDLHNEGGYGYDPNNTAAKRLERDRAEKRMVDNMLANYDTIRAAALVAIGFVDAATTQARREQWNAMVKAGQITIKTKAATEAKIGWRLDDLRDAVALYGLSK